MTTATYNGTVIAESDATVVVEGNHYFPPESVRHEYLTPTEHHTTCPWKGVASYFTIDVDGERAENGAWTYSEPKEKAADISGHIAFYRTEVAVDG